MSFKDQWTWIGLNEHWLLFVLISSFYIFWLRVLD